MDANEVLEMFKSHGWVMLPESFLQEVIDAIHGNVGAINMMTELEALRGGAMCENMSMLSTNLSSVAFTLEEVMYDQQ